MMQTIKRLEKKLEELNDFFYDRQTDGEDPYYLDMDYASSCFDDDEYLKQRMIDFLNKNELSEDAECQSDDYCQDCAHILFARLWYEFEDELLKIWYKDILAASNFTQGLIIKRRKFKSSLINILSSPETDKKATCLLCGKLLNAYPINGDYTIDELTCIADKKDITQDDINYVCLILDNLKTKNIKEIELIAIIKDKITCKQ